MSNRLTAKPTASSPSAGDVLYIDGATGVRALDAGYPAASTSAHNTDPAAHNIAVGRASRYFNWVKSTAVVTGSASIQGHGQDSTDLFTGETANSTAMRCAFATNMPMMQTGTGTIKDRLTTGSPFEAFVGVCVLLPVEQAIFRFGFGKNDSSSFGLNYSGFGFELRNKSLWTWFKRLDGDSPTYYQTQVVASIDVGLGLGIRIVPGAASVDVIEFYCDGALVRAESVERFATGTWSGQFIESTNGTAGGNYVVETTAVVIR